MSHTTEKPNIVENDATLIATTKEYVRLGRIATKLRATIPKHPHFTSTEITEDLEHSTDESSEIAFFARKLQTKPEEEPHRDARLTAVTDSAHTNTRTLVNWHSGKRSDSYLNPSYFNVNHTPKTGG